MIGLAGWQTFVRVVHVSYGYHVRARYASLPPDDNALAEWLKVQPGVVAPHAVNIWRTNQNITVFFLMSRDLRGNPRFPDLESACKKMGYAGQLSLFTDCPQREWYAHSK